nr:N-alpha-acetyltransferase 30 [Pogona vitticeps]
MAEVPSGPSSLLASSPGTAASLLSPFPGATEEEEEEEEEEEKERRRRRGGGGRGAEHPRRRRRPPPRRNHQLNGLIAGPDLRHLRSSLKGKVLNSGGGESQHPPGRKESGASHSGDSPGKAMGHGQETPPQQEQQQQQQREEEAGEGERERSPCPPSLRNHHRVACPPARTAQPPQQQQPQRHPHHPEASAPSAGDRNGLAPLAAGEQEQELEREEEEEEEDSLLLLSRSLASSCSLQKCPLTDSSWAPQQVEEEQGDLTIRYVRYESELQMPDIMRLITKDLSEPYSIYTYRYFIHNWPQLCFLAMVGAECVGAIVCKLDMHKKMFRRGYIAMLAVDSKYRRKGIGTNLVKKAIYAMVEGDCDEVVLETEITNKSALKLYENLGFVRDKRLFRYYLNGVDALRLKLWLR